MYNIKEAAARSGVSVPTLRAWERRYAVVSPERTAAGYRLYDDDAIDRLRRMRGLLGAGWRPREAAAEVLRATQTTVIADADTDGIAPSGHSSLAGMVEKLVAAAAALDPADVSAGLDEVFARVSYESAMDEVIFPALREVGRGWQAGRISVAAEHAFANAVQRRLAIVYEAARRSGDAPQVIVGLPPGARHDLGALAFAVALRRLGLDTLYLGADVPQDSWLRSLRQTGASVAVIGVVTPDDVAPARRLVDAVNNQMPAVSCVLGGHAASALEGVRLLPGGLAEDARLVRSLVR